MKIVVTKTKDRQTYMLAVGRLVNSGGLEYMRKNKMQSIGRLD